MKNLYIITSYPKLPVVTISGQQMSVINTYPMDNTMVRGFTTERWFCLKPDRILGGTHQNENGVEDR